MEEPLTIFRGKDKLAPLNLKLQINTFSFLKPPVVPIRDSTSHLPPKVWHNAAMHY